MQGIDQAYSDLCIRALLGANQNLMEASAVEAITAATAYGKGDTLALDAIPEIEIERTISRFDARAILVTEELGGELATRINANAREPLTLFFADPTDRSSPLRDFLQKLQNGDPGKRVGELMLGERSTLEWEERFGAPAFITGACSAITCVREGLPLFSAILNYVTQEIILISKAGIKCLKLAHYATAEYQRLTTDDILSSGHDVRFLPLKGRMRQYDDLKNFITFLGKAGYAENFRDCSIFADGEQRKPCYGNPGGPTRALYLSDRYPQEPIGFILSNGEKIGEWVHWLTAVRFASHGGENTLQLFEITHQRPWTKEGISMAPSPAYSIFRENEEKLTRFDVRPLYTFKRPSQFRATLVVAPADNSWLLHVMKRCQYRELRFD